MIGSDLPNYIKYNPKLFAQTNSETGLVLETFNDTVSLALGNNASNYSSNVFLLKSYNNNFKLQYENSNIINDVMSFNYDDNNVSSILNGNLTLNQLYTTNYSEPSIILNDDINQVAGIGYIKDSNIVKYKTTYDGKHVFTANAGSLEINLASLQYSNSVQQLLIHGDNIPILNDNNPSLRVQGSTKIDGNLNVDGSIVGIFPTHVVQLNSSNKIDPTLLPQLAPDFRVLKSGKNIGIGTKYPISKLHLYNGDLLVQHGWIGINLNSNTTAPYPPKHPLHIDFETNTIPAIALTSNNLYNFIAYADHPAIGIGTDKIDSPNISIYAAGDIQCSNIVMSGLEVHKNNQNILYYEQFNTIHALVSKFPLVLDDKLFVSTIASSSSSHNVNFSNCDVYIDKDLYVRNYSIFDLIEQHFGGQYIGFGTSNPQFKLHVEGSNANSVAGFGSVDNNGALIYVYTSNNIDKNYVIGIDENDNFIINDNIHNDLNGIKYKFDHITVDNITTSNLNVITTTNINGLNTSNGLLDYNYIRNKPFDYIGVFDASKFVTSNSFLFDNPTYESVIDAKGRVKLYNDSPIFPIQVECDLTNVSFLTNTGTTYKYNNTNTNTTNPLSSYQFGVNFALSNLIDNIYFYNSNQIYLSSDNNRAYLIYNGIHTSNIIYNNPLSNVLDVKCDNDTVYYLNTSNNVYYSGYIVNIDDNNLSYYPNYSNLIENNTTKFTKIAIGVNFGVLLDEYNVLYSFGVNNLKQLGRIPVATYNYNIIDTISGLPAILISDISCGDSHTGILLANGDVWTFGDNTANKRGYSGDPLTNNALIPPQQITTLTEKIIKIKFSYNNSVLLSENGNVYIFGDIANKLNPGGSSPYLLTNIPKIIDISVGKNNLALLTYYNEIYTLNNINTTGDYTGTGRNSTSGSQYDPLPLVLPIQFYGTSLYSHGSVVIGNNFFNLTENIPKSGLLVEGLVGIGSVPATQLNTSNYSLIVSGDVNLIDGGNIYKDGVLFVGGSGNTSVGPNTWNLTETAIYYKNLTTSYVGIGTTNPNKTLDIIGDIGLTGNIYINDELLINDFVIWETSNNAIYYNNIRGRVGVNTDDPKHTLDVYDTSFSIRNVVSSSNKISVSENLILPLDAVPQLSTIDFGNNIVISGDGSTLAGSTYKTYDGSWNSNNVYLFKKYTDSNSSNYWKRTTIMSPYRENVNFGDTLAISEFGDTLVIGSYKDYVLNGVIKNYVGSLHICDVSNILTENYDTIYADTNSNISILLGNNNIDTQLGEDVAISAYGNTIVSSALGDNNLLYIFNKVGNSYTTTTLDYSIYSYHYSFEPSQDINDNGDLIVSLFEIDQSQLFIYNNLYIINHNGFTWEPPRFLNKNINNNNYTINNVSISGDGTLLVLGISDNNVSTTKDVVYIYKLSSGYLLNNSVYNINTPHYTIQLESDHTFNAKVSKDGTSILLIPVVINTSDVKSYHYRYDKIIDSWTLSEINHLSSDIYTVKGSITRNGYESALALGNTILVGGRATTPLNSIIHLYEMYYDKTTLHTNKNGNVVIGSNQTLPNFDLFVHGNTKTYLLEVDNANISNLNTSFIGGDGYNIFNINIANINGDFSNIKYGQLFIGNSNHFTQDSNLYWNFESNILNIAGLLDSFAIKTDDGYGIRNLNLNSIGSNSVLDITHGGTGNSNYIDNLLLIGNNEKIMQSCNLMFLSDNIFYVNGDIVSGNNIIGNGYNISNINIDNIEGGLIKVLNGGTGASNLQFNEIIIGNGQSIYQTSNFVWDMTSNRLGINTSNPIAELEVVGTIIGSKFYGDAGGLSNLVYSNVIGEVEILHGGTGLNYVNYGSLLVGNKWEPLINTPNLIWSNISNLLTIDGSIYANTIQGSIIGNACSLSNIVASNIIGKVSTVNGGIGDLDIKIGELFFGGDNYIDSSSNLYWFYDYSSNNSNSWGRLGINTSNPISELDVFGTITAFKFVGDGADLSNINFGNISGQITVENGGTGINFIDYGHLLFGNYGDDLLFTSNLVWSNINNLLTINGSLYANDIQGELFGDGINISNLVASNLSIGEISVINGGTGCNSIPYGTIMIGNFDDYIITTQHLVWSNISNLLTINGSLYANDIQGELFGNGTHISNIVASNVSLGEISVINGGTSCNSIPYGELLIGNFQYGIITSPNLLWSNVSNLLTINGSLYANDIQGELFGDGINISNLVASNLSIGEISVINGGTGCNSIPYGTIMIGNLDDYIITTQNLIWSNISNLLTINGSLYANNIQGYIIGDAGGLSNIYFDNISGQIEVENGGTSCNVLPYGELLVGNIQKSVITSPNLLWSNISNLLTINGSLYANDIQGELVGDGINISNLVASNIIGEVSVFNGGTGCNLLPYGELLIGNVQDGIITSPNLFWSNISNLLTINGSLYANDIQGELFGDGINISNLVASNFIGEISVFNGGTGCNSIPYGSIMVGYYSNIYTTDDFYWNISNSYLGIKKSNPQYELDIAGNINFTGSLLREGELYIYPGGWCNLALLDPTTMYTLSNVLIGYDIPDSNYMLKVKGSIYASDDITAFSDSNYKINIETIDDAINKTNNIRGVYYNRLDNPNGKKYMGVIAQELLDVIPEVVYKDNNNELSVAYGNITGLLIESIKELTSRVNYLEKELEELKQHHNSSS